MDPATAPAGTIGTWAFFDFSTGPKTFGMDISAGVGGSDVPANEIVFTADVGGGVKSAPFGGPAVPHVPAPLTGGDDLVIQPDGDWVHVGDFTQPLTAYSHNPVAPFHTVTPSALDIQTIFANATLPFVFGSRATVCDSTGDLYISYSGSPGGSGIFRVDETLTTATLVLTIGQTAQGQTEGLHDLILGPSTGTVGNAGGNSVFFTVHDLITAGEEVWEVTVPECPTDVAQIDGRMTGGGSVFTSGGVRVTHGFELHCSAADSPNNLQVNWPKATGNGKNRFHLETLTSATCSDTALDEGNPVAGFDTYMGTGLGRLNGVSGAAISFTFTDAGEPGKGVDLADISIIGAESIAVSDFLDKGNQQAHEPE